MTARSGRASTSGSPHGPGWKKWAVVAACAAVALVVVWVTVFRGSDEDRIRAVLARLAKAVSVKEDDNLLARNGRIRSEMKDLVTDLVSVDVAELGVRVTGRPELVENATKIAAVYSSATVELSPTSIKIDDAGASAKVEAVATVTGARGGEKKTDRRDVHLLLHKDGEWRITTIDVLAPQPE